MCRRLSKRTAYSNCKEAKDTTEVRGHLPNNKPQMLGKSRGCVALLERIFEEPESVGRQDRLKRRSHPWKGKGLLDLPVRVVISDQQSAKGKAEG